MRVSLVAKTNASAFGPRAGGARQELKVSARVRLHRAGDVAQQDESARRDAAAPMGEPHRIACCPQAGAQCPSQVDALTAAPVLVAPHAARWRCELEPRHELVEPCELVWGQRVEAHVPQALLVARLRDRELLLDLVTAVGLLLRGRREAGRADLVRGGMFRAGAAVRRRGA